MTSTVPNATVRADKAKYGAVKSVTYASARTFLAARPEVVRYYDAPEGSSFYTYWDTSHLTYRQVYFEDERSAAAKYEYAITTGLAGVGIWTLGNDAGYPEMCGRPRGLLRARSRRGGLGLDQQPHQADRLVAASLAYSVKNLGDVPERGEIRWRVRNEDGRQLAHGTLSRRRSASARRATATARIQSRIGRRTARRDVDDRGVLRHADARLRERPEPLPPAVLGRSRARRKFLVEPRNNIGLSGVSRPCDSTFRSSTHGPNRGHGRRSRCC